MKITMQTVAFLFAFILQIVAISYWGGAVSARLEVVEKKIDRDNARIVQRIERLERLHMPEQTR